MPTKSRGLLVKRPLQRDLNLINLKYLRNYMPRPKLCRRIRFNPDISFFKPQGRPMRGLKIVELSAEEAEALRLKNIKKLDQTECAKQMNTSQSTFQRILSKAYEKISQAIIEGKAIKIIKH